MIKVYNKLCCMVVGPTIKGVVGNFLPGTTSIPKDYLDECLKHSVVLDGKEAPGPGRALFSREGPLKVIGEYEEISPPKEVRIAQSKEETPLPESLVGFSVEEAVGWISKTNDYDLLVSWGSLDERETVQEEIFKKLKPKSMS